MGDDGNRRVVERYMEALPSDFDTLAELRDPGYTEIWPQSGERILGHENYRKIHEAYPGGLPTTEIRRIMGSEDRVVQSPMFTLVRISGAGDVYTVEGTLTYPGDRTTNLVAILELRDGKVARATQYFADPFEAPEWRAQWVERA
jgi:hypothetical protein